MRTFENQIYYLVKAKNGAMVDAGEITSVYYFHTDEACQAGTYKIYATDGWQVINLGRHHSAALRAVGERNLNTSICDNDELGAWLKQQR